MRKLKTIQTQEKLNDVYVVDEIGPGNANHQYLISKTDSKMSVENYVGVIQFQKGPRKDDTSEHGVIDTDLLEIVRDRLKHFQKGPYANDYNAQALVHVEEALKSLNKRVEDRIARNVLGTYEK